MCTLVMHRGPGAAWPVLIAANRDEVRDRPSAAPARHWPERPRVVAGLDLTGGGSWLGLSDRGLVAAVMNRTGTLGPAVGKRSRGELVLMALDHDGAGAAARALASLDPDAYRPFNLVVVDADEAWWLRHGGEGPIAMRPIPVGLHLLSATELDDLHDPRIAHNRPRFLAAACPRPEAGDWVAWQQLLADADYPPGLGPEAAMLQDRPDGFGTRSSALLALSADPGSRPHWLHAEGRPDRAAFLPVDLGDARGTTRAG
jgi:uncharacterized protein with NRDE domain